MYKRRIKKVQEVISKKKIPALLISNPINIFYLTGFKGISEREREALALLTKKSLYLLVPKLYQGEAKKLAQINKDFRFKIVGERNSIFGELKRPLSKETEIGIEADNLTISEYKKLKEKTKIKIIETSNLIEETRVIKDKEEIKYIKKAVQITDTAFAKISKKIRVGMTEKQIAKIFEEAVEEYGGEGLAFETIVASGAASALPHYKIQNKKVGRGILLIDGGAKYKGYCGDLTRTFYLGTPDDKFIEKYKLVLRIQKLAIKSILPNINAESVWKKVIKNFGIEAKYFIHGLGHGVGLEIHEVPYLRKGKKMKLSPGMAVTIEPGLYYPEWGGIRIEDFVILTKDGCKRLSLAPKELKDIIIAQ